MQEVQSGVTCSKSHRSYVEKQCWGKSWGNSYISSWVHLIWAQIDIGKLISEWPDTQVSSTVNSLSSLKETVRSRTLEWGDGFWSPIISIYVLQSVQIKTICIYYLIWTNNIFPSLEKVWVKAIFFFQKTFAIFIHLVTCHLGKNSMPARQQVSNTIILSSKKIALAMPLFYWYFEASTKGHQMRYLSYWVQVQTKSSAVSLYM